MKTAINHISKVLTFSFLLFTSYGFSQDYKSKFKADICDCFHDEFLEVKRSTMAFESCFKKALPSYATLIDAKIEEENVNIKFSKGQQARKALKKEFQIDMIYSCNLYFLSKEEEHRKLIAKEFIKVSIADLETLNQRVAMYPNAATYLVRGSTQFFLGNFKDAELDIIESINLTEDKDDIRKIKEQTAVLALIYEGQKRFSEASELYGKVYEATKDIRAAIYQALANKKSVGAKSNLILESNSKANTNKVKRSRTRSNTNESTKKETKNSSDLKKLFKLNKANKMKSDKNN